MIQINVQNGPAVYRLQLETFVAELAARIGLISFRPVLSQKLPDLEKLKISWLIFSSALGRVAIGFKSKRHKVMNFRAIIDHLNVEFGTSFQIESDRFCPDKFPGFKAYTFDEQLLLCLSYSLPPLEVRNLDNLRIKVDLSLYSQEHSSDTFYGVFGQYSFNFKSGNGYLEFLGKESMENINLELALKIGNLQLALSDLLSLKAGSQISFNLPESSEVFLEIGNNHFAKGIMSKGKDESFVISLESLSNLDCQ